jgi:Cys-tRNA synthase (O-phospho-L-seryl-tRNA:Cys-tRNA synthase)
LAGLSSALVVRCSVAVGAKVLAAAPPIGPLGTSAEFSVVPSEPTLAVAFSLKGACWAAGGFYLKDGAKPVRRPKLRSRPKRVQLSEDSAYATRMQKRAKSARAGQKLAKRVSLGMALAFGLGLAGLSSALVVRCSVAVGAKVLAAAPPIGPLGTSAEFSVAVGRAERPTGPPRSLEKQTL